MVKEKKISKKEAAAIADVFGGASEIETPKSKKNNGNQISMGKDFEGYVSLILLENAIEGAKKQLEGEMKEKKAFTHFFEKITETGNQPSQIEGVEGRASAMFQFKKKGAGFTAEIAEDLKEHGIDCERKESIPERFVINPLILQDQAKLAQLSVAIKQLGLDYEIVQKQKPVFKYQFTEETIRQISKIKDKQIRAKLLRDIATIAVAQAKLDGIGIDKKTSPEQRADVLATALQIIQEQKILNLAGLGDDDDDV